MYSSIFSTVTITARTFEVQHDLTCITCLSFLGLNRIIAEVGELKAVRPVSLIPVSNSSLTKPSRKSAGKYKHIGHFYTLRIYACSVLQWCISWSYSQSLDSTSESQILRWKIYVLKSDGTYKCLADNIRVFITVTEFVTILKTTFKTRIKTDEKSKRHLPEK